MTAALWLVIAVGVYFGYGLCLSAYLRVVRRDGTERLPWVAAAGAFVSGALALVSLVLSLRGHGWVLAAVAMSFVLDFSFRGTALTLPAGKELQGRQTSLAIALFLAKYAAQLLLVVVVVVALVRGL